eukprot:3386683-Rhodomonas_salina.1
MTLLRHSRHCPMRRTALRVAHNIAALPCAPSSLRSSYVMPDTDLHVSGTTTRPQAGGEWRIRRRGGVCIPYAPPLPSCALAMRCPVLTHPTAATRSPVLTYSTCTRRPIVLHPWYALPGTARIRYTLRAVWYCAMVCPMPLLRAVRY